MPTLPTIHYPLGSISPKVLNHESPVSFQPRANTRGTLDIVAPCISAMFISVYVVWHHNLPASKSGKIFMLFRRLLYAAFSVVAPEFMLFHALRDWVECRFWRRHLFHGREYKQLPNGLRKLECSKAFVFLVNMGGLEGHFPASRKARKRLSILEVKEYAIQGQLPFSNLSLEAEIGDHSKADSLLKLIAVSQSIWFYVRLIARVREGLEVTPLEVTTSAYVFSTIAAYALWFRKPYDVHRPITVTLSGPIIKHLNEKEHSLGDKDYRHQCLISGILIAIIISTILGAIHIACWTSPCFPTEIERLLWHLCSIIITSTPIFALFCVLVLFVWDHFLERFKFPCNAMRTCCISLPAVCVAIVFVAARVGLLVLAMSAMRELPPSAYFIPEWVSIIPVL
ncbi:hypothetical protein DL96DRAFT_1606038 [Flagelloscypha sp. PMI_526]|nr:hypothetical protein DL96DRAFT_1606038 [Flagelloscypha sp. PMI_526]